MWANPNLTNLNVGQKNMTHDQPVYYLSQVWQVQYGSGWVKFCYPQASARWPTGFSPNMGLAQICTSPTGLVCPQV